MDSYTSLKKAQHSCNGAQLLSEKKKKKKCTVEKEEEEETGANKFENEIRLFGIEHTKRKNI